MADFLTPKTLPAFVGDVPEGWAKQLRDHIEKRDAATVKVMAEFRKGLGDRDLK